MSRFRLGFDIPPSQSGPGRYVRSIVDAVDPEEFAVVTPPESGEGSQEQGGDASGGRGWLGGLRSLAPRSVRLWVGFLKSARERARELRERQIDLFHAQNCGCEESPVAAHLAGIPHVLGTFHVDSTYDLEGERSGVRHRLLEYVSNRALNHAIAVSEATKRDWVRRTRIPERRVTTIHNGVDPDRFRRRVDRSAARRQLGLPEDAVIFGGVGRLDAAKGFEYAIESVAGLPETIHLAIAGRGVLREPLEQLAERLGVASRVHFLGFQSDVGLVYDALDVFLLSSLCEALPYALLEAMSHELPVVGTRVAGVPEVIVEGEVGFLADPRDPESLIRAALPLVDSSDLRTRLGAAGRERVIRHFHERDMVAKTIEVYRSMLRSGRRRKAGQS